LRAAAINPSTGGKFIADTGSADAPKRSVDDARYLGQIAVMLGGQIDAVKDGGVIKAAPIV
jgi:hypothetical protein